MAMPTEIFLKDYKMPDYYFEKVSLEEFLDYVSSHHCQFLNFLNCFVPMLHGTIAGGSEIFLRRGKDNS